MSLKNETGVEQDFVQCVNDLLSGDAANTVGESLKYCAAKTYSDALPATVGGSAATSSSDKLFGTLGPAARQLHGPQTFRREHLLGPGGERRTRQANDLCGSGALHFARQVMYGPGGSSQTLNTKSVSGFGEKCRRW